MVHSLLLLYCTQLRTAIVPEFGNDTIREKFVYSYRIIYRIHGDTLTIAAVIHGKKLFDKLDAD